MKKKAREGRTRFSRSWMWEEGVRVYYGDPDVLMCVVGYGGKPTRRRVYLPLYPPAGADHWEVLETAAMALLSRASQPVANEPTGGTLIDVKAQKAWPTLWAYLTQAAWEDGTPRVTSGLTIFAQDGMLKGLLKENEQQLCLWVAANGLHQLLDALDMALTGPAPDWRRDRRTGGGVAKKKNK